MKMLSDYLIVGLEAKHKNVYVILMVSLFSILSIKSSSAQDFTCEEKWIEPLSTSSNDWAYGWFSGTKSIRISIYRKELLLYLPYKRNIDDAVPICITNTFGTIKYACELVPIKSDNYFKITIPESIASTGNFDFNISIMEYIAYVHYELLEPQSKSPVPLVELEKSAQSDSLIIKGNNAFGPVPGAVFTKWKILVDGVLVEESEWEMLLFEWQSYRILPSPNTTTTIIYCLKDGWNRYVEKSIKLYN